MASTSPLGIDLERYKWGFHDSQDKYVFKARKGLDADVVNQISHMKGEPDWMRAFRLHAYEHFTRRPMPQWGADLNQIDFNDIYYYLKPTEGKGRTWEEVPAEIKRTFDRPGTPRFPAAPRRPRCPGRAQPISCGGWVCMSVTASFIETARRLGSSSPSPNRTTACGENSVVSRKRSSASQRVMVTDTG